MSKLDIQIDTLEVTKGNFIAITNLGGITIRGQRAPTESMSVLNLLDKLTTDDDAILGLDLALSGTNINDRLAIGTGE